VRSLNRRGFSLVEMMVVVALIGIVAAFAIPSMIEMKPKDQLRSAAKDLVTNLRQARALAITGKAPSSVFPWVIDRVDVGFDALTDTYTTRIWTLDPTAVPNNLVYKVVRMGDYNQTLQLSLNTALPGNTLTFRRNGSTDNFASFQLTFPTDPETRRVVVTRAGLARIDF
jgi:prepilin-type N-terminal cleavage/methylation domain-containing protein